MSEKKENPDRPFEILTELEEAEYHFTCGLRMLEAIQILVSDGSFTKEDGGDALLGACLYFDATRIKLKSSFNRMFDLYRRRGNGK